MLQTSPAQFIEGITVYQDSDPKNYNVFYLVGGQPQYRLDAQGRPLLNLLKYRTPIEREDGRVGGGFLLLDVAFTLTEEKKAAIAQVLQPQADRAAQDLGETPRPVEFGTIRYVDGTCNLIIAEGDGTLVEKVKGSGMPSLYGENTAIFGAELTAEGATFFEQALQSGGPTIGIEYDLTAIGTLPIVSASGHFHSRVFYQFIQEVDTTNRFWGEDERTETIREFMRTTSSITTDFVWGELTDPAAQAEIRDFVMDSTAKAAEDMMVEAIEPLSGEDRELPKGIEDLTRKIRQTRISDFQVNFRERRPVEWSLRPNGLLPPVSSLTDANGNPLDFADFTREIDLDDPFFRQVRVNVMVNADFEELPLHSVEVKAIYKNRPMTSLLEDDNNGEAVLTGPDDMGKFAAFVENEDYNYQASFQINYRNESRHFQSPVKTTNEGNLTINVGEMGILDVEVAIGDVNWDEVTRALVTFRYEDTNVPLIERQLSFVDGTAPQRITEVIFQEMREDYTYDVKYFMKDGSEFVADTEHSRSPRVFVNDVFSQNRTILVNGLSDFTNTVANIFLDLTYDDDVNDHHLTNSVVLNGMTPFVSWSFPVISATGGEVSYAGTVAFKDGTVEPIERTVAESNTILVPRAPAAILSVEIIPDLIDWTATRLVQLELSYADPDNDVAASQSFTFSQSRTGIKLWTVPVMDEAKQAYSYEWTFFQADGSRLTKSVTDATDTTLIIDPLA